MTNQERITKNGKVYDAWRAGFITTQQCEELVQKNDKEYYIAKHGEFNLSDLT